MGYNNGFNCTQVTNLQQNAGLNTDNMSSVCLHYITSLFPLSLRHWVECHTLILNSRRFTRAIFYFWSYGRTHSPCMNNDELPQNLFTYKPLQELLSKNPFFSMIQNSFSALSANPQCHAVTIHDESCFNLFGKAFYAVKFLNYIYILYSSEDRRVKNRDKETK